MLWRAGGCGRLAEQLGQFDRAQTALEPAGGRGNLAAGPLPQAVGRFENHLLHQAVEGWIEGLTASVDQVPLEAVAAPLPALEPEGHILVEKKAVTIDGDAQPPAAIVVPEVLQRGIQQQPIQQHGLGDGQLGGAHRQELGTVWGWNAGRIGSNPIHADLTRGAGALHRLAPGAGRIGRDSVAAGCQGRDLNGHLQTLVGGGTRPSCRWARRRWSSPRCEAQGWLVVDLNHHVGAQAQPTGIDHGPVAHPYREFPRTRRQHLPIAGMLDGQEGSVDVEGLLKLLDGNGRGHLLQGACRRRGGQGWSPLRPRSNPAGQGPGQRHGWLASHHQNWPHNQDRDQACKQAPDQAW